VPLRDVLLDLLERAPHWPKSGSQFQVVLKTLEVDDSAPNHSQRCVFGRIPIRQHICDALTLTLCRSTNCDEHHSLPNLASP
jgi:hypothetical protein